MFFVFKVDWWDFFGSFHKNFLMAIFFNTPTHIKWLLASMIALISSFRLGLMTSFWKVTFFFLLIFEKWSSHWKYSLVYVNFLIYYAFKITFLLLFNWIGQLLLDVVLFLHWIFGSSFWFVDLRMKTMFHPAMAFPAIHSSWTIWGLNWFDFIEKIPIRTFLGFIVV